MSAYTYNTTKSKGGVFLHFFTYSDTELEHLRQCDAKLRGAIDRIGPVKRAVRPDLFESLVSSIISQQISGKAADTVSARLTALCGGVTPERVCALSAEAIQKCGMSMRKATYIKSVAELVFSGGFDLGGLRALRDDDVRRQLSSLPGIGVWTAEMLMIFSMQRPDIISYLDLGIRRGMMRLYGLDALDKDTFERLSAPYAPHRSLASLYLWHMASE